MRPRLTGFTLIELLVVISIIALLIGILLPALSAARGAAQRAQSTTHVRSIHQGMLTFADANNGYFPGVTASGRFDDAPSGPYQYNEEATDPDGRHLEVRLAIMLEENWVAPEILVSPGDADRNEWLEEEVDEDEGEGFFHAYPRVDGPTPHFSYALLLIRSDDPSETALNEQLARNQEWRATSNHRAIVIGDRNTSDNDDAPESIWRNVFVAGRNDNSVAAERGYERRTQMGNRDVPIANDNIFVNHEENPDEDKTDDVKDENVVLIYDEED